MVLLGSYSISQEQAWIESRYQECIQDNLPCECNSFNPPNFIFYDTINTKIIRIQDTYAILNHVSSDTISFNLQDRPHFIRGEIDSLGATIRIIGDSMFVNNYKIDQFITYIKTEKWGVIENLSCLKYLNAELVNCGYNDLYKILKSDTLRCTCDTQFGISKVDNNKKNWTFERREDILYMYKWKYPKDRGLLAKKKLWKKFKLKNNKSL
jgi:hypothetical protein